MKAVATFLLVFGCVLPCKAASSNGQTPYEMLIQSRRNDAAKTRRSAGPVGSVTARAKLRLMPVTASEQITCLGLNMALTTTVKAPQIKEIPSDAPKEPVYFSVRVGGRELVGTPYRSVRRPQDVKMYLDTDGDGLWSDETECIGLWQRIFQLTATYLFGPISTQPKGAQRGRGAFYAQCSNGERVVFYPTLLRRGKVTLDGQTYDIAIVDADFDGKFNGTFVTRPEGSRCPGCDVFAIDLNRNSEFNASLSADSEFMPLSRLVQVYGRAHYGSPR